MIYMEHIERSIYKRKLSDIETDQIKKMAEEGDGDAMYEYAIRVLLWPDESAADGNREALKDLHLKADIGFRDELIKATAAGCSDAANELGNYYYFSDFSELKGSKTEGAFWWKKAAEMGNKYALYKTGCLLLDDGDADDAIGYLKRSSDLGYMEASFELFNIFKRGKYAGQDDEKADFYLRRYEGQIDAMGDDAPDFLAVERDLIKRSLESPEDIYFEGHEKFLESLTEETLRYYAGLGDTEASIYMFLNGYGSGEKLMDISMEGETNDK